MAPLIKYNGHRYVQAAAGAATIDDKHWRHGSLLFWIYAIVESKTGADLPVKTKKIQAKRLEKMPAIVRENLSNDADTQQRIFDAVDKGMCHFIALEGVGWEAGERKGAKGVSSVQSLLEWVNAFRHKNTISGSKLIWAQIDSYVGGHQ